MNSKYMSLTLLVVVALQMAIIFHLQSKLDAAEFSYKVVTELAFKAADHALLLEKELKDCQENSERAACESK